MQATVEINQFGEVGPRPRPRVWSAHCAVRSGRGPSGTPASRRPGTRRTWPGRAAAGTEPRGRRLGDPRHRPPSSVAVHISEMTTPRDVWSRSSEGDSATRAPTLRASRVFKRRPVPQGASGHRAATPRLSAGAGRRRASVPSPRGAPRFVLLVCTQPMCFTQERGANRHLAVRGGDPRRAGAAPGPPRAASPEETRPAVPFAGVPWGSGENPNSSPRREIKEALGVWLRPRLACPGAADVTVCGARHVLCRGVTAWTRLCGPGCRPHPVFTGPGNGPLPSLGTVGLR